MDCEAQVGRTIWLRVEICQIKRDPKCPQTATYEVRTEYLEKVRRLCRELVEFGEYSWADILYNRCVQVFSSIPKLQLEKFSEERMKHRFEALTVLYTNLAFCYTKKKQYEKAIKAADQAIEMDPSNSKAFYRKA